MGNYEQYLKDKRKEYGDKFDPSGLDRRFRDAFEHGYRIRVKFYDSEVKTGTVSITTGWKPSFILMLSSRSLGSSWLLNKEVEFTTDKVTRLS